MIKLATILLTALSLFSDVVVVTDRNSLFDELSTKDIKRLFLSKTSTFQNSQVKTAELSGADYKEQFYQRVCNKTATQLRSYWASLIFTGKGKPPKQKKDLKELFEYIKNNSNSITYIDDSELNSELKILYRLP